MKKKYLYVAAAILVLAGLMVWGKMAQKNAAKNVQAVSGALVVSEKIYDFGTISMKDGEVSHIFTITNTTQKDIFIRKLATSCMCTRAYIEDASGEKGPFSMEGMGFLPPANELIKAGGSIEVKAVYDPNAHGPAGVGNVDRFVMLFDKANRKLVEVEIKATVTP